MLPPAAQTLLPAPPLGAHGGATPLAPGTFQVLTSLPFDTMVTSLPFDTKGPRHRLRARAQAFPHHPPSSPPTSDVASANTGFLESAHDLGAEDGSRHSWAPHRPGCGHPGLLWPATPGSLPFPDPVRKLGSRASSPGPSVLRPHTPCRSPPLGLKVTSIPGSISQRRVSWGYLFGDSHRVPGSGEGLV